MSPRRVLDGSPLSGIGVIGSTEGRLGEAMLALAPLSFFDVGAFRMSEPKGSSGHQRG